jgi:PAS domain S-box-containing protein
MSNSPQDNYLKKELYELIKADESIFDFIQESSLDGLWYWDLENPENEWMNPRFWTVLGYNPAEKPHKSSAWQHIINQDDLVTATENFAKHCENPKHPYDQIVRYTHKSGATVWIRCRGMAIRDKNGKPIRMLGAHHDITNLKTKEIELNQAKEKAEESERQLAAKNDEYEAINEELRQTNQELFEAKEQAEYINANVTAIIEGTAESIWAFDRDYNVLYINNAFQKEFHAAFGIWLNKGSSLLNVLPEALRPIWNSRYDRTLSNEQFTVVDEVETAFGKIFIQVSFNPIVKINKVIGGSCFGSNITQRMQSEEALRKSEANLRNIIDSSPVAYHIYMLESENRLVFRMFNPSADMMLHMSHEQFIGQDILEAFPALAGTGIPEMYKAVAKGELNTQNFEIPYNYKGINGVYDVRVFQGAEGQAVVNFTDISVRKQAEEELQKSQALYHDLVETSQDLIWQCDAQGHYIYLNPAYEKLFGYQLNEMLGRSFTDFQSPQQAKRDIELFGHLLQTGSTTNGFETVHLKKDGTELHLVFNAKVVYNAEGHITGTRGTAYDITQRKRAEEALRNSERKTRAILDKSFQFIGLISREGILLDANLASLELAGASKEEVLNKPFWECPWWKHSIDLQHKLRKAIKSASEGEDIRFEASHPAADGSLRYVDFSLRPVKNDQGDVIYLIPEGHDITERKKAEEELQCNFNFQEIIADISSNFVISSKESFDIDINEMLFKIGNYFQVDRGYLFLFSDNLKTMTNTHEWCSDGILPQKDNIQNHPLDAFPWWTKQIFSKDYIHIPNVAELPKEADVEKKEFHAQSIKSLITIPVRSENKIWGFVGFDSVKKNYEWNKIEIKNLITISNIISNLLFKLRNEEHLLAAKEKAEESDRLKTAFLQNMSHEIRTPMNAIIGFSSLLPDSFQDKEKLEDFSKIINQRSEDLLDIINDILDISKIESGQSTLNIEECNINETFSELNSFFRDYQNRTKKQHIELLLQPLNGATEAIIKTDKIKLKQILVNLISNAFKFTETGTIRCGCELENNKLKFFVSDTGVGIPKHKYDFVFERFAQLNNSSCQNIGGTGLGLPIVKGLVGLLGGQVWLESECDKGTTFFFTIDYFPLGVPPKHAFNGAKNNDGIFMGITVLIVEDDAYNAMYLNEILLKHVASIYTVNNGADAIEFVKNNTVDVVLMDVRLPDMTGYEATKEILIHNPAIMVIAQTAYAAQDEHQKALNNGCVDYISKPTKQEQLLTILRKHLKQ